MSRNWLKISLKVGLLPAFFIYACSNDLEKVDQISSKKEIPIESSKNVEVLYSDSAVVKVKVLAPEMDRYVHPEEYLELPKGVHLTFYDNQYQASSTLKANYAIRKVQEQKMEARGNVEVVNNKNEKLNTEKLIWDENNRKIYTDAFAKITTDKEIIYGNGFEANEDFTQYRIFNIKGIIDLPN
ncbi:MAG TPA: LPS export ABC transporter periplasmic protein LptC [Bacteroidia bacterium]|nr:LPS export ABC transporter periplasmic protein LptC [Bacteroidia bacterium]HNT79043.1 LPS export ABC transporter periplasmic protein LptC [Bacteroidia bacterium]